MSVVCQRWVIDGRVQGVGNRAWMVLAGSVRNLVDGRVEALVCGENAALATLHRACLLGPRAARVSRIEVSGLALDVIQAGSGFVHGV